MSERASERARGRGSEGARERVNESSLSGGDCAGGIWLGVPHLDILVPALLSNYPGLVHVQTGRKQKANQAQNRIASAACDKYGAVQ